MIRWLLSLIALPFVGVWLLYLDRRMKQTRAREWAQYEKDHITL